MSALKILQKIVNFGWNIYQYLNSPPDQNKVRQEVLAEAIQFLHREGGYRVDVRAIQGQWRGAEFTDFQVSINYRVQVREHQFADQHTSYTVDTTSWKALRRDLNVLGKKFAEAANRAYKDGWGADSTMSDYSDFLSRIDTHADVEPK